MSFIKGLCTFFIYNTLELRVLKELKTGKFGIGRDALNTPSVLIHHRLFDHSDFSGEEKIGKIVSRNCTLNNIGVYQVDSKLVNSLDSSMMDTIIKVSRAFDSVKKVLLGAGAISLGSILFAGGGPLGIIAAIPLCGIGTGLIVQGVREMAHTEPKPAKAL